MTAKPGSMKLYIYRGDPWEVVLSSVLDGEPEPVVAADVLCQIRATVDSEDVVIDLAPHVAVSGADDDIVTISLTGAETAELPTGTTFVWDFQPDSEAETWVRGNVTIDGDVSREGAP